MLTKQSTKRATVIFFLLSLIIWGIKFYVEPDNQCERGQPEDESTREVVENKRKGADLDSGEKGSFGWLLNRTKQLSPTHLKLDPACPAAVIPQVQPPPTSTHQEVVHGNQQDPSTHFASIAILGEVHLRVREAAGIPKEAVWSNISSYLSDSDAIITSLSVTLEEGSRQPNLLRRLKELGSMLIVSIGNTIVPSSSTTDGNARRLTRVLEWAGIDWLGVNAKKHHVAVVRSGSGERFGVLAFCGVYKECVDNPNQAFYPFKYTQKAAKIAIEDLNQHGVATIIVMMYWGLETSYFPDETALTIARYLAKLKVAAVIGYHPNSVQQHAYFGNTLVVFSPGKLLSSSEVTHNCWEKSSETWKYSKSKGCQMIHPRSRDNLRTREHQSRIYKLELYRNRPATAHYMTAPLLDHRMEDGHLIRSPSLLSSHSKWTLACSKSDTHCLSCIPF